MPLSDSISKKLQITMHLLKRNKIKCVVLPVLIMILIRIIHIAVHLLTIDFEGFKIYDVSYRGHGDECISVKAGFPRVKLPFDIKVRNFNVTFYSESVDIDKMMLSVETKKLKVSKWEDLLLCKDFYVKKINNSLLLDVVRNDNYKYKKIIIVINGKWKPRFLLIRIPFSYSIKKIYTLEKKENNGPSFLIDKISYTTNSVEAYPRIFEFEFKINTSKLKLPDYLNANFDPFFLDLEYPSSLLQISRFKIANGLIKNGFRMRIKFTACELKKSFCEFKKMINNRKINIKLNNYRRSSLINNKHFDFREEDHMEIINGIKVVKKNEENSPKCCSLLRNIFKNLFFCIDLGERIKTIANIPFIHDLYINSFENGEIHGNLKINNRGILSLLSEKFSSSQLPLTTWKILVDDTNIGQLQAKAVILKNEINITYNISVVNIEVFIEFLVFNKSVGMIDLCFCEQAGPYIGFSNIVFDMRGNFAFDTTAEKFINDRKQSKKPPCQNKFIFEHSISSKKAEIGISSCLKFGDPESIYVNPETKIFDTIENPGTIIKIFPFGFNLKTSKMEVKLLFPKTCELIYLLNGNSWTEKIIGILQIETTIVFQRSFFQQDFQKIIKEMNVNDAKNSKYLGIVEALTDNGLVSALKTNKINFYKFIGRNEKNVNQEEKKLGYDHQNNNVSFIDCLIINLNKIEENAVSFEIKNDNYVPKNKNFIIEHKFKIDKTDLRLTKSIQMKFDFDEFSCIMTESNIELFSFKNNTCIISFESNISKKKDFMIEIIKAFDYIRNFDFDEFIEINLKDCLIGGLFQLMNLYFRKKTSNVEMNKNRAKDGTLDIFYSQLTNKEVTDFLFSLDHKKTENSDIDNDDFAWNRFQKNIIPRKYDNESNLEKLFFGRNFKKGNIKHENSNFKAQNLNILKKSGVGLRIKIPTVYILIKDKKGGPLLIFESSAIIINKSSKCLANVTMSRFFCRLHIKKIFIDEDDVDIEIYYGDKITKIENIMIPNDFLKTINGLGKISENHVKPYLTIDIKKILETKKSRSDLEFKIEGFISNIDKILKGLTNAINHLDHVVIPEFLSLNMAIKDFEILDIISNGQNSMNISLHNFLIKTEKIKLIYENRKNVYKDLFLNFNLNLKIVHNSEIHIVKTCRFELNPIISFFKRKGHPVITFSDIFRNMLDSEMIQLSLNLPVRIKISSPEIFHLIIHIKLTESCMAINLNEETDNEGYLTLTSGYSVTKKSRSITEKSFWLYSPQENQAGNYAIYLVKNGETVFSKHFFGFKYRIIDKFLLPMIQKPFIFSILEIFKYALKTNFLSGRKRKIEYTLSEKEYYKTVKNKCVEICDEFLDKNCVEKK